MTENKVMNNIKLLAWFNFLLDLRFYTPIAILYFVSITGSFALGMGIFSIVMLSSAIFEIPTGIFSDRIGRKKTILLGSLSTVFSVLMYALGFNYSFLVVGAIFEGLARSFYSGNNDALLHDTLLETGNQESFSDKKGKTDSTAQMAIAVVSVAGSFLATISFSFVFWLSLVPAILGVIVASKIVEPQIHKEISSNIYSHLLKSVIGFIRNEKLRLLSLSSMIGYAQSEAGYLFRSAFYQSIWPIWAIGLAQGVGSIGASMSFYWSGKVIKRFGELRVVAMGKIYSITTNLISTIFPTVISPIIMSSNSFTFGATTTASQALKHKEYTNEERSTMSSLNSLLGSITFAVVAYLLGLVADYLSPAKGIMLLQVLAFISLLITLKLYRKEKNAI